VDGGVAFTLIVKKARKERRMRMTSDEEFDRKCWAMYMHRIRGEGMKINKRAGGMMTTTCKSYRNE
jgi:hypothetical protein